MNDHRVTTLFLGPLVLLLIGANFSRADIITFQQEIGGYTNVVDAYISTDFAGTDSTGLFMGVFSNATSREDQALVRFNNLFGNGAGQIPLTASITTATLTLTLTGQTYDTSSGTSAIHQLSKDWTTSDDWTSSFWGGNGIQNDGTEAVIVADDTGTWLVSGGTTDFDVLSSVQAWQAGTDNYGWYLHDQSNSDDRAYIATSDFGTTASRPLLTVEFTTSVTEPASLVLRGLNVGWESETGQNYSVLTTTNLVTVPWAPVVPGWTNSGTGGILIYTNAYQEDQRFFKVGTWIP